MLGVIILFVGLPVAVYLITERLIRQEHAIRCLGSRAHSKEDAEALARICAED